MSENLAEPPAAAAADPDPRVAERLERFTRTRDLRALWPTLTAETLAAARGRIERAVREVLAGSDNATLECDDAERETIRIAGFVTGTSALLGFWQESGRLRIAETVQPAFLHALEQGRERVWRILREAMPAFDALLARGVSPVVIKGLHVAFSYHVDPGVRPMNDVDVVVAPEEVATVESALAQAGFVALGPAKRRYKRDWAPASMDRRFFSLDGPDARNPWQLEVHASFDRDFASAMHLRLDGERNTVGPFNLDRRALRAPAQPLLLVTLAAQLASELESMRLMRIVDLVMVIRRDTNAGLLDWEALDHMIRRTRAGNFLYPALELVERLAPGTVNARTLALVRGASTRAARHVTRGLVPGGGYADETSVVQLVMWADTPYTVAKVVLHRIRDLATSPQRWRSLLRRLTRRGLHLRASTERSETSPTGRAPTDPS